VFLTLLIVFLDHSPSSFKKTFRTGHSVIHL
jgi:hypothetical protein